MTALLWEYSEQDYRVAQHMGFLVIVALPIKRPAPRNVCNYVYESRRQDFCESMKHSYQDVEPTVTPMGRLWISDSQALWEFAEPNAGWEFADGVHLSCTSLRRMYLGIQSCLLEAQRHLATLPECDLKNL